MCKGIGSVDTNIWAAEPRGGGGRRVISREPRRNSKGPGNWQNFAASSNAQSAVCSCVILHYLWVLVLVLAWISRSRWPRGLRRENADAVVLGLRVRIPGVAWMSVSCECYVFSGRGFCDGPIALPEESYRVWCVSVISKRHRWGHLGLLGL
jgi:hypothetical protein